MTEIRAMLRRKVRLYDADDFFWDGTVTEIDAEAETAQVDYGDWIQEYPVLALKSVWAEDGSYECILIPQIFGVVIADYRDAA
ncbi:MAG: hypothetical protein EOP83_16325 [Verrucomicrobiaceae bacterium]|nr:MAG: hypothetical protein EOP83_16325 [Verrucomicrobiaceae bacterium]